MSETLRDLVVSLSLQTDNFTRNIKSVSKQIAEAESQFKLAAAGVEGFEHTATGLATQLSTLERRLSLQKDAVNQYQRALEAANNKLSECYNRQNDYAQRLEAAKAAQQALKEQVAAAAQQVRTYAATLGDSDSATIAAKANLDALKVEYRASVQEVKKLSGQNEALKKTTQNAADAVSQANTNFNMARAGVKQTEAEINRCNQALRLAQTNWDAAGKSIDASRAAITTFGKEIGLAESRFRLATAGIKDMDTSVEGLSAKLTLLREKLDMLDRFLNMDEAQRKQIIQYAAIAAAAGPVMLMFGKIAKGVGTLSTGIGKFATAVGKAGGGIKGFMTVLSSSPAVWLAVAAATITATVAIADYVSGAKQAREALEGMQETAEKWKSTAAETFYGKSEGLSFFGMSKSDFTRDRQTAQDWLNGLIAVWTDGKKESNEIVSEWTDSFKSLTDSTRTELMQLKETADEAGYTSVSSGLSDDIAALDAMDAEIASLLKKRQNGYFSEKDKIRLQELIDTRAAIEVKYHLSPADADGFDTIRQKLEAEVARAQARGKQDADVTVYENAVVAAAQGLAAMNSEINAQYDKEYALIQLIEDSAERQAAMDALNARYNENRRAAAQEYAALLADIVMPVWEQEDIQQAASDVDLLTQKLREYSAANETEKPALLEDLNAIAAAMDEGAMTEYIAILTQIQSLLDSGMSEAEVQAMFPEIDFSTALEQIASIQAFLNNRELELPGLTAMFGDALPEEVLTIATDLDMTGAQARWAEFAANPGAITTDAVIAAYTEAENVEKLQPQVDAFIAKYTEIPEGADKSALTPEGLIAYVSTYAEVTNGADVSGLTPENVTAMVSAYKELADGADISTLTPDQITAYVMQYLEKEGVDTSGLTPAAVTAFVMAYEEVTGGALTTSLTPDNITAMVAKYLEAENVDISALSPDQIEAIVTAYAEATGVDKSTLLQDFTAYITRYDDTNAVKPRLNMTVGIYGYDLMAYRKFIRDNPVEVQGIVKLGEVYENPSDALLDPQTKFWQDGQEIPVEAVPTELLTADKVAVLDADGTLHVLIAPKITGTQEAIDAISPLVDEVDQFGTTTLGMMVGMVPQTTMDLIGSAVSRINSYTKSLDYSGWERFWASIRGESVDQGVLNQSMLNDFSPERVAELSTYVGEIVSAILQGKQVSEDDVQNLQEILTFLQGLDTTDTGTHILEGVAEGMTAAGWDSDAETVASNLEAALNTALQIHSPSERVKPVGENVSAGVGQGMSGYDFTSDMEAVAAAIDTAMTSALPQDALSSFGASAAQGLSDAMTSFSMSSMGSTVAASVRTAVNTSLTGSTLRSAGLNAMAGLRAGILAGQSGVISAMRSAARSAVNAAKSELKIHSPSQVFEDEVGVMTMRGLGKGVLKESKAQAKIIRNASRFLTGEAGEGTIVAGNTTNTHTYHQDSSVNFTGSTFYIRDEKDVQALAIEIAALTRRRQHGRGLKMA